LFSRILIHPAILLIPTPLIYKLLIIKNPKLTSVQRQNINLLPHTLHLPTITSVTTVKNQQIPQAENILSPTFRKIYNTNDIYTHPNYPSI